MRGVGATDRVRVAAAKLTATLGVRVPPDFAVGGVEGIDVAVPDAEVRELSSAGQVGSGREAKPEGTFTLRVTPGFAGRTEWSRSGDRARSASKTLLAVVTSRGRQDHPAMAVEGTFRDRVRKVYDEQGPRAAYPWIGERYAAPNAGDFRVLVLGINSYVTEAESLAS